MSWADRLQKNITLTAPHGVEFKASWVGDEVTKEMLVGLFNYPKAIGTRAQHMGAAGSRHNITIYFTGADNDIQSRLFFDACDRQGKWVVDHPVDGKLELTLLSVSRKRAPVTSGEITECTTDWVEPFIQIGGSDSASVRDSVNPLAQGRATSNRDQFKPTQNSASEISAIKNATNSKITGYDKYLKPLVGGDFISTSINMQNQLIGLMSAPRLDIQTIASQVELLVTLPASVANDISIQIDGYKSAIDNFTDIELSAATPEGKNSALTSELFASAAFSGLLISAAVAEYETKQQAMYAIDSVTDMLNLMISKADAEQELFSDSLIKNQYVTQAENYTNLINGATAIIVSLLNSITGLKTEKKITLLEDRSPLDLVVEYYGSLGLADEHLDFFIETNGLTGDDVLLMRAGAEALFYV